MGYSAAHTGLEAVGAAYREALIALKAARPGEVMDFGRLDPVAWVLLQQSPEDLRALVERFLPLPPKALRTLEVYLELGGDLNAAAQALHIHPNTLRYRLGAIEGVLGASLRSPETLARVHLALRARGLLEER
jgi:DNA-binding PucR family transcriptional regulator